jgi:hypothetical protein
LEIDPSKLDKPETVEANQKALAQAADAILNRLLDDTMLEEMPHEIKYVVGERNQF